MAGRDPYSSGKLTGNPYKKKREVTGPLVVILDGKMENRGLELITPPSRCVRQGEVHELIVTDEPNPIPGTKVDRIAYLGFFALTDSGVLVAGDNVIINGQTVGKLAGFDETHMPNHLNIVIRTNNLLSGMEMGHELGQEVRFELSTPVTVPI